jgi:ATP-dependent helicase HrpB
LLQRLEALDSHGRATDLGRRMGGLPVHPRLAHMLLRARRADALARAADLAALIGERDILKPTPDGARCLDLDERLSALAGWRAGGGGGTPYPLERSACRRVDQVSRRLRSLAGIETSGEETGPASAGALTAMAYPDRVAQRRGGSAGYLLANGRGAELDPDSPLAGSEFLAVAAMDAGVRQGRIFLAARLARTELQALFADQIAESDEVAWDAQRRGVTARRLLRLGALVLARGPVERPSADAVMSALLQGLRREGLAALPWKPEARALQARVLCLRDWDTGGAWPDFSDAALLSDLDDWLGPWLQGLSSLEQVRRLDLEEMLRQSLGWHRQQRLDQLAPQRILVPSGARRPLSYRPGEPPVLAVRLQEMFGQRDTPRVCGGRIPVTLHLLSPARRPLQITQDLAGFWDRTYSEVRKEMKGRYPKHYWPEDPRSAVPTARVRPKRPS